MEDYKSVMQEKDSRNEANQSLTNKKENDAAQYRPFKTKYSSSQDQGTSNGLLITENRSVATTSKNKVEFDAFDVLGTGSSKISNAYKATPWKNYDIKTSDSKSQSTASRPLTEAKNQSDSDESDSSDSSWDAGKKPVKMRAGSLWSDEEDSNSETSIHLDQKFGSSTKEDSSIASITESMN